MVRITLHAVIEGNTRVDSEEEKRPKPPTLLGTVRLSNRPGRYYTKVNGIALLRQFLLHIDHPAWAAHNRFRRQKQYSRRVIDPNNFIDPRHTPEAMDNIP